MLRPRRRVSRRVLRRRRTIAAIGAVAVVGVTAVIVFTAATSFRVLDNISDNAVARAPQEDAETPPEPAVPDWNGPVDLLIMGSDTRVGQVSGDYGSDDTSGARSDVMMVLHVSADHRDATLVSIPRDTMLPAPECTTPDGELVESQSIVQINGLLDNGPFCSLDAVRAFTGLDINHFIVVDFDGVIGVTEAIGGVDVCVADDVDDAYSGLSLTAGEHTVAGPGALAFLRTRHGFADGSDLGRIGAQQTFMASLARKVKSAGTLTNPAALFSLADAASRSISVDEGLADAGALVGLAGTLAGVDLERMVLVQLPVEAYDLDANRVQPIADQAAEMFAALAEDRPVVLSDPESAVPPDPVAEAPADVTTGPAQNGLELPEGLTGQTVASSVCAS